MRWFIFAATLGVANALVSACAERSVSGPMDRPAFNFANGPESPGPIIFRTGEAGYRVSYSDPVHGLTAIHGGDVVEFCLTGETGEALVELQVVFPPEEQDRILLLLKGHDVETTVWATGSFDCDVFTTTTPLATGTVDLTNTDNDLLAGERDNRNHNAFGFVAQGTLTRPDGAKAPFNGVSKCVWDGDDFDTIKCHDSINLQ